MKQAVRMLVRWLGGLVKIIKTPRMKNYTSRVTAAARWPTRTVTSTSSSATSVAGLGVPGWVAAGPQVMGWWRSLLAAWRVRLLLQDLRRARLDWLHPERGHLLSHCGGRQRGPVSLQVRRDTCGTCVLWHVSTARTTCPGASTRSPSPWPAPPRPSPWFSPSTRTPPSWDTKMNDNIS